MSKKTSHVRLIWTAAIAGGLLIVLGGAAAFAFGYDHLYTDRIFPGVRIVGVRLDGLTADEAREALYRSVDEALKDGLRFQLAASEGEKPRDIVLNAITVAANDPDASRDLVRYNLDPALAAAMAYGRSGNPLLDAAARSRARIRSVDLDAGVSIDEDQIRRGIQEATSDLQSVRNATLDVSWDANAKHADISVQPERSGRQVEIDSALRVLRGQAERLRFEPIILHTQTAQPVVTAAMADGLRPRVPEFLAHAPFHLQLEDGKTIAVDVGTLAGWIGVGIANKNPELTIVPEKFAAGIRALAPDVEKTAKRGSFAIQDGRITDFEAGTEGITIDDATTLSGMLDAWKRGDATSTFPLVIIRTEPAIAGQDPERLGIHEIIGVGRSNFSGSPTNRRKNIANGIHKVNGTMIAPGENFSLLKTLGPIVDGQGWLPELVIKGNKTEPELGGGLCQIGTTAFRAALASGLPIVERRNHSYRVRYYEPAGTDATIYEPSPDFQFKNDTGHHILIHAYSSGDEVIYEFWGTRDGRTTLFKGVTDVATVDALKPRVFNVTAPPPMKLVETLDLPPGQKKCTEVAHAGADAEFTAIVTAADGTSKEQTFASHYRPWQAVCLIGVEKLSEPPADGSLPLDPDAPAVDAIPSSG